MSAARRAVLFDLDGTLVDSAPDIAHAADSALIECGFPARGAHKIRGYIGNGAERLIHRCLTHSRDGVAATDLFEQAYARFKVHYDHCLTERTVPYPGVIATLQTLCADGYVLACVTNKPERFTQPLLLGLDLARYFEVTVAGDTLLHKKPHPAPLLHVLAACNVSATHAAMVGDSLADLHAARAAGVRALCVTYGYSPNVDLRAHHPDALIDRFEDVLQHLSGF